MAEGFVVDVEAQKKAIVTGTVLNENGTPIGGANVTILYLDRRVSFEKRIRSNAAGRFYTSVNREGSYLIYVTYDDKRTPGVDYVPERWRTWLSSDSVSSHKFILKNAASIYLDGNIRHVETNKAATRYQFIVLEPTSGEGGDWTGPVRDYGSFSHLTRFLSFDERLVVVPAETEVKIGVKAYFPAGKTQTFTLTGKTGYFKLSKGENLHIDIRESNILSNIEYVKKILSSGFSLLDDCRTAGFLVEMERQDLFKAYDSVKESSYLLRKGLLDQSFAKLRSAYILATRTRSELKELIESSSPSLFLSLFLFLFVAFASANLIAEKSTFLEIMMGKRGLRIPITSLMEIVLYLLLFMLFYFAYPGSRLVSQLIYISMSIFIFLVGKSLMLLFPRLTPEGRGEGQPIQIKSAIAAAFSMSSRNLRRRKMRTLMNIISVMILVFGFITLTSISPGYGISIRMLRPVLPVNAMLIKDLPLGGSPQSFVSLPDPFIEWLESHPNVTLVSPTAKNSLISFDNSLGYLYSASGNSIDILGIIGIIPSKEINITGLNRIVNKGDYLEDNDTRGILIGSSLQEILKVNVGDKLYGFGQEFIIRGFFDEDALSRIVDIDGSTFRPYCYWPSDPEPVPCPSSNIIILTYKKALTLPKVSTSRVAVQLLDMKEYEQLARIVVLTYEYVVYISNSKFLAMYSLGEYIREQGMGLIPPLMVLVMLNIGLSMFATVNERKNEIATLSSVGLNPTHIAALFIAEALIIGFIGGGLGYLLGISGYRLLGVLGGLQVREKVSAEWGLISIFFSGLTAVIASLVPSLHSSTLVTPSLLRKWRIEDRHPTKASAPWVLDLPIKLMSRDLESFTTFISKQLQEESKGVRARVRVDRDMIKEETSDEGMIKKILFTYYVPEKQGRTLNELTIQPAEEGYDLKLICISEGVPKEIEREIIHATATYVRKLVLEWSTAACEVTTSFDPYLSQLYNLIDRYSPTTLYIISTYPDAYDKIEKLKNALILRGIRPPKFAVSFVNPYDTKQIMKAVKDLVSRADIVCISGKDTLLCTSLAMEAVKQNKNICYVVDDRPVEERMKKPFQNLKMINISYIS